MRRSADSRSVPAPARVTLLPWKQGSRRPNGCLVRGNQSFAVLQSRRQEQTHFPSGAYPLNICRIHPYAIQTDGAWMVTAMANNMRELRPRPPETEKITINLGYVDLGHVDLMVQEGFYSNRTDFIRTAIRNQLERHADVVKQSTARKSLDLGLRNYSREDLEAVRRAGEMLHINVLGLASISEDVTPELARATIASVSVLGALHASPAVKAALADRTR
jgi:Arc/MetJ-type ribon-helix-helix transcriptional regulator